MMLLLLQRRCSGRVGQLVLFVLLAIACSSCQSLAVAGYAFTSPELNRHSIAGLWRLTTTVSNYALVRSFSTVKYPMKEFTTYPKPPLTNHEVWLWLNEDGSFQQFQQQQEDENQPRRSTPITLASLVPKKNQESSNNNNRIQGTWDYRDGKLILATDRPNRITTTTTTTSKKKMSTLETGTRMLDTILVGRVVATQEFGLIDNPVILEKSRQEQQQNANNNTDSTNTTALATTSSLATTTAASSNNEPSSVDTHLSVPKGSVKIGKFVYPKHHPSFFDQPLMRPTAMGSFQLRQVLGTLNTQRDNHNNINDQPIIKFTCHDFFNKRFLLTSHPIEERQPKGNMRWSIKYNKFVEDVPKKAREAWEAEQNRPVNIRVMELQFFANRTFATVAGLGSSTILRGKYDVIGTEQDQLWMQVWRFGFGRSVSGSVYSEGPGLTQDDAKSYWGQISYEEDDKNNNKENGDEATIGKNEPTIFAAKAKPNQKENDNPAETEPKPKRLQVQGSVLFGFGLEPLPIGRFIMREATAEDDTMDDDDDEEEDDDDDDDDEGKKDEGDMLDWTNSFQ